MTPQQPIKPQDKDISLVGLGPMGVALGAALVRKGHTVTVWNRTPEKADGLVALGARRADTVAAAIAASPITLMCLNDYDTMYEVFGSATAALADRVLVNLNSGTPGEARAALDWASGHGFGYLDGAIMVPPPLIGESHAVFLYSGDRKLFDRHRPVLAELGDPRYLGEDIGLAVLYNTAMLEMMYTTLYGWLHATALVGSAGVSATEFADLAQGWFMPTVLDPESLARRAPTLDAAEYPGTLGTMVMNLNGLRHITRTSVEQGVHSAQPRFLQEIAERTIAAGYGENGLFSVYETFKKPDLG
ncbi:NAD(P)-dependent oxidoreductase [Nocardia crassostreae]|uniref:NAD(P)-dependent oxidoreductase n=1 Tax=Nocardia crassostreae TaxID=53428 RepID=UPI00083533CD|nr:NAD(P)-binding domain-containing protein [Nocardia crassostreae]